MKIPQLEDISPRLRELRAKRLAIQVDGAAKRAKCATIRARLATNEPNMGNPHGNEVRKLLGEAPVDDALPDSELLAQTLNELSIINAAIETLEGSIAKEKASASRLVCENVRSDHDRLAKQFAQKLIDLHAAHSKYSEFLLAVENTGASTTALASVMPSYLGQPKDRSGAYHWSLKEFRQAGHVQMNEIPEAVR